MAPRHLRKTGDVGVDITMAHARPNAPIVPRRSYKTLALDSGHNISLGVPTMIDHLVIV